jgi:protein SCO1
MQAPLLSPLKINLMQPDLEQRKRAFQRLASSGGILLLLVIGYYFLLQGIDQNNGLTGRSDQARLPVLRTLTSINLTNQLGSAVGLDSFRGAPWFANIIFTRCPGPCATMTQRMKLLQDSLTDRSSARFVSISTDPDYDVPEVLQQYARKFEADTNRWSFLTGSKDEILRVSTEELLLVLLEKAPNDRESEQDIFLHSTLTVLLDSVGRIRGSYEMLQDGEMEKALKDLQILESE